MTPTPSPWRSDGSLTDSEQAVLERLMDDHAAAAIAGRIARTVPARYADAVVTDLAALTWLEQILLGDRNGLLLLGPTGRGKTHLAYGLIRMLIAADPARFGAPPAYTLPIVAGSLPALLAQCRPGQSARFWQQMGQTYEADALSDFQRCDLLFLDDVGAEKASEWTAETLYQIIDYRYNHMKPLIVASNLPVADLAAAIGDRIASRLTEMCRPLVLKGDDRRRTQ